MTDEERNRVFGMIESYGPQAFLNAYLRTHPRQSDRIKSLLDRRGPAMAARMLFGYTATGSRRTPGPPVPTAQPPPGATGLGFGPSGRPEGPGQALGAVPEQRGAVGTGLTAQPGLLAGATEVLAREHLGGPSPSPAGAGAAVTGIPGAPPAAQPPIEQPGQALPSGIQDVDRTTGLAPETSLITGMEALAQQAPTIDPTQDPYALFDSFSTMAKKSRVPLPVLMGMIKQESQFDPGATSKVGALGLLQLMQDTATDRGLAVTAENDERLDPVRNIEAGLAHMEWLRDNYSPKNLKSWLAAYNAGHTRLKDDRWKKMKEPRDYANSVAKFATEYMKNPQLLAKDFLTLYKNIHKAKKKSSTAARLRTGVLQP